MHIFHIPSWYPCRHGRYAGISCENLILSLSRLHPEIRNSVSLYQENTYWWLLKYDFTNEVVGFFRGPKSVNVISESSSLEFYYAPRSIMYSTRLGYIERKAAYKAHLKNFLECVKKHGMPDLIHAQVTNSGGYAAWRIAKEYGIPYIITERFAPFPHPSYIKNEKLIPDLYYPLYEASKVISVSPAFANIISEYCGRDVLSIPNFLDEEFFKPSTDGKDGRNHTFRFATLALSYEPRKGVDTLIRAIKIVKDRGFKAAYDIGGGREDFLFENVKKLADDLDVKNEIKWFGKVDRKGVVELMQNSDCFVLASQSESFGTVYIEALACGKPVIATRCGGPESIVNDINGILVSIDNPEELADAMIRMMNEYKNFDQGAIRNDFLKRFSKTVVVEKYIDIYNEISRLN